MFTNRSNPNTGHLLRKRAATKDYFQYQFNFPLFPHQRFLFFLVYKVSQSSKKHLFPSALVDVFWYLVVFNQPKNIEIAITYMTKATSTLLRLKVRWSVESRTLLVHMRGLSSVALLFSSTLQPNYTHITWPLNITQHPFTQRIFPLSVTSSVELAKGCFTLMCLQSIAPWHCGITYQWEAPSIRALCALMFWF